MGKNNCSMQSVCVCLIAYVPHRAEKGLERREDTSGSVPFDSSTCCASTNFISRATSATFFATPQLKWPGGREWVEWVEWSWRSTPITYSIMNAKRVPSRALLLLCSLFCCGLWQFRPGWATVGGNSLVLVHLSLPASLVTCAHSLSTAAPASTPSPSPATCCFYSYFCCCSSFLFLATSRQSLWPADLHLAGINNATMPLYSNQSDA